MKFITAKPDKFHLYLVAEFFRRAKITAYGKAFNTVVNNTHF